MEYFLEEYENGFVTHKHRITQPKVTAGRSPSCVVTIRSEGISWEHFSIEFSRGRFILRDYDSTNHTFVNGEEKSEAYLHHGDEILVGRISLTFLLPDAQAMLDSDNDGEINEPGTGIYKIENKKRAKFAGVFVAGLIFLSLIYFLFADQTTNSGSQVCGQVQPLENISPKASFGKGRVTFPCGNDLSFSFKWNGGRAYVVYRVAGAREEKSLVLRINDKFLTYSSPSTGWSRVISQEVPRKLLKKNDINTVGFEFKDQNNWGIKNLNYQEKPLPAPNREKAIEYLRMAKKKYDNFKISPGNLFEASTYINNARDYLELYPEKNELTYKIEHLYLAIERDLDKIYRNHISEAKRALQFDQVDKAYSVLKSLLREFPKKDDSRHQKIRSLLIGLEEAYGQ